MTLKDIHPFFKDNSVIFQANNFIKNPAKAYPITNIALIKLQSDILKFIEGGAVKKPDVSANIAMTYISEAQVLQASMQFINTLILLEKTIRKPISKNEDVYVSKKNSKEANLYAF